MSVCVFLGGLKWEINSFLSPVPSSFRALGVRVTEGKDAKAYVFMCVFESKGFTTLRVFVGEPPAMQSLTHTRAYTHTHKHAQHCNDCQGARVKVNKGR